MNTTVRQLAEQAARDTGTYFDPKFASEFARLLVEACATEADAAAFNDINAIDVRSAVEKLLP